jgi:hypothetical protein
MSQSSPMSITFGPLPRLRETSSLPDLNRRSLDSGLGARVFTRQSQSLARPCLLIPQEIWLADLMDSLCWSKVQCGRARNR